ncbi:hypothetical protein V8G56_03840 [Gaetbulibacter aquiaggeris]|uniref:GRAM domain-containing protein n=1 Tax=Gaetbulibacter aquiaggeris TaxID=1735373 RepID=A0ABW7MNA9_9FLAO
MINRNLISSDKLKEEEYEITSAHAKYFDGERKISGELIITSQRIVFSSKSGQGISLDLDEIELVKSNKHIFAVKDKLTIVGKKKEYLFFLNYSEDWVSLIEQLLKHKFEGLEQ